MKNQHISLINKQITSTTGWWWLFGGLFLFEYLLFRTYILREIVNYYPAYSDQANYLDLSYALYELILRYGFFKGVAVAFHQYSVCSTVLFYIQAAVFFLFTGASRYYALLLNFIYFIILQVVIISVIKKRTNNYLFAVIFIGLLLLSLTPYLVAGGPADFRMDFMVFCLYGILVSSVLESEVFLNKKWTILSGCVAGLLVALRIFALAYIIGIVFFLVCFLIIKRNDLSAKIRLKNLLIFAAICLLISLPVFWWVRDGIYGYYVLGHVLGPYKYIRSSTEGATGTVALLLYYPKSILVHQLGFVLVGWSCALLLIIFASYRIAKAKLVFYTKGTILYFQEGLVFLGAAILAPFILLTLDLSKSPIVAGVLTVPIIWLIMWIFIYYYQKQHWTGRKQYLIYSMVVLTFLMGVYNYAMHFSKHGIFYSQENVQNITKMYDDLGDYVVKHHWDKVELAVDQSNDYLTHVSLSVLYYEHKHIIIKTGLTLGSDSCAYVTLAQALHELEKSNVFIANLGDYEQGGYHDTPWPLSISLKAIRPQLRQYAEHHFSKLGDYSFKGYTFRVYVRP